MPAPDTFAGPGRGVPGEHADFLRPPGPDARWVFEALGVDSRGRVLSHLTAVHALVP
ncbi:hypothetical protein ACWGKS_05325 [Nocardiopsis sp. NPDC055879]